MASLVVVVAQPGAAEAQDASSRAGKRSSFGLRVRNVGQTVLGGIIVRYEQGAGGAEQAAKGAATDPKVASTTKSRLFRVG